MGDNLLGYKLNKVGRTYGGISRANFLVLHCCSCSSLCANDATLLFHTKGPPMLCMHGTHKPLVPLLLGDHCCCIHTQHISHCLLYVCMSCARSKLSVVCVHDSCTQVLVILHAYTLFSTAVPFFFPTALLVFICKALLSPSKISHQAKQFTRQIYHQPKYITRQNISPA